MLLYLQDISTCVGGPGASLSSIVPDTPVSAWTPLGRYSSHRSAESHDNNALSVEVVSSPCSDTVSDGQGGVRGE